MKESEADSIIQLYRSLEEQAMDFLRYVPYDNENMNVWSPRLATIIIESCGLVDSLFRYISPNSVTYRGKKKKKQELSVQDFRRLHAAELDLLRKKAILLQIPLTYVEPYKEWSTNATPHWWQTYNKLKHDRIQNMGQAKLTYAIDALAAALLLISSLPKLFIPSVVRRDWINLTNWNPKYIIPELQRGRKEDMYLETELFAVYLGAKELPEDMSSMHNLWGSKKLAAFIIREGM